MAEEKYSTTDLKTPAEWQEITGVTIIDADGWGGKNGRPFTDPIGYVEWNERMAKSTVRVKTIADMEKLKSKPLSEKFPRREDVVTKIVSDFESTYVYFLLDQNFKDGSVAKAAYYSACERMVRRDPGPDPLVQTAVLERLRLLKDEALGQFQDSIELIFEEVANTTRMP